MNSFRTRATRAGTYFLEHISYLVLVAAVGMLWSAVQVGLDSVAYRGIDAHPARVTGTVAEYHEPWSHFDWRHPHTIGYEYGAQSWRSRIPLPQGVAVGDDVCLEVDATSPGRARVCGSGPYLTNLLVTSTVAGVPGLAMGIRWWLRRGRERERQHAATVRVRHLAAAIRERILAGELPVGSALPGVDELAARHGVGESTVDAALGQLRDEGIVGWRLGADGQTFERRVIRDPATIPAGGAG